MTKQIFFISFLILTVSCSDSKNSGGGIPGAGLAELTDTQKQSVLRLNQFIEDVSIVTQNPAEKNTDDFDGLVIEKNPGTLALTKAQQELVEKMDQAKQTNQCQVYTSGPPDTSLDGPFKGLMGGPANRPINGPTIIDMKQPQSLFSISGSQCPLSYSQSVTSSPKQTGNGYSVVVKTEESFKANVNSPTALGLDITSSRTTSGTAMSFALVSAERVNLSMNMSALMIAESQTFGQVISEVSAKMTGSLQLNPQTGETISQQMSVSMTLTQKYIDFKVVGYITATLPNFAAGVNPETALLTAKYHINGKSVTEQEFTSVFGNFEMDLN